MEGEGVGWSKGGGGGGNPMTSNIDFNISGTLGEVSAGENGGHGGNGGGREGWRGRRRGRRNREQEVERWMQVVSPVWQQYCSRTFGESDHF